MSSTRVSLNLLMILVAPILISANGVDSRPSAPPNLDGKWLFESAQLRQQDRLDSVWTSVLTINGNSFGISNFLDPSKELKGKIRFDESDKSFIEIELAELDFSSLGEPLKIEPMTLKGIIQIDRDDAVSIAVSTNASLERPMKFESTETVLMIRLRRAPKDFNVYPNEISIEVETADGHPVEGAIAAGFQSKRMVGPQANPSWKHFGERKTNANGIVVFPFGELPRLIIDEQSRQMAFPKLIPFELADGKLKVRLAPLCEVRGTIVCEELTKAGQPLGWTNVYLEAQGNSVADCSSENGHFDFLVPAGDYKLEAYGGQLAGRRVSFSVQPGQTELTVPPVSLKALEFALLKGKPAPGFVEVAGWSGEPTKLSDLRGKFVLVDFWGYWCGPCVQSMPILIELHEKFRDKGLAIVGVHVDANGEVDTSEKLQEKTSMFVDGIWKGKQLPFPSALVSGKPVNDGENRRKSGTPGIYGIQSFPTTILIDPNGNVVDKFSYRDLKHATEQIEQLLKSVE